MRFAVFVILVSFAAVHDKVGAGSADGTTSARAAKSCYDIYRNNPRAHSGYYYVKRISNTTSRVFCHMEYRLCGVMGGWMEVTTIDMAVRYNCPQELQLVSVSSTRLCKKKVTTGCSSLPLTVGVPYAEVCGSVLGFQFGSPDAGGRPHGIDEAYIDGVSITHGLSPRRHIWSYIAGYTEDATISNLGKCPCAAKGKPLLYNNFVGNHFYCESGNPNHIWEKKWYMNDRLWDGYRCPAGNSCCANSGLPFFYRALPRLTTDDIEVRVCADQAYPDEDIGLERVEIYVR